MDRALETKRHDIELAVQNVQPTLRSIFLKYKAKNRAIKHFGLFGVHASLLAHSPEEGSGNEKVLKAQYTAMSQFFGAHLESFRAMQIELSTMAKNKRAVATDYGSPKVLRITTEGGNAVGAIYVAPVDPDSLIFSIITTRAMLERDPYVVREEILLEDLDDFSKDAYAAIKSELSRIGPSGKL